jgi:hypothetical protein
MPTAKETETPTALLTNSSLPAPTEAPPLSKISSQSILDEVSFNASIVSRSPPFLPPQLGQERSGSAFVLGVLVPVLAVAFIISVICRHDKRSYWGRHAGPRVDGSETYGPVQVEDIDDRNFIEILRCIELDEMTCVQKAVLYIRRVQGADSSDQQGRGDNVLRDYTSCSPASSPSTFQSITIWPRSTSGSILDTQILQDDSLTA